MATIKVPSQDGTKQFYLESADFPDASTQAGQDAIVAAVAALNPNPSYVPVDVWEDSTLEVGSDVYPLRVERVYWNLQSWFASL
ncbi:hypothetical protein SEA_JERM_8 [Mycobacterium phage Jerm]|uniref:Uncharacterized protein n=1 Tax=Mycobacterium phage Jerm TaxID=1897503 RepID=A0A1D8EZK6_9CAUD|nr:hypothetical protein SEA_JERM_8 [Mycobacterium phage Jerm]